MSKLAARIGIWASISQTVVGYGYLIVYIIFLTLFPIKPWSNIQAFAADINTPYMTWLTVIQVMAFLQAFLVLVISVVLHEFSKPEEKILTRLAKAFALSFTILASLHYYMQWTGVRQSILSNDLEGLGMFVQFNFDSPISAINMLGWMFFYGLTTLSLSPLFKKRGIERWIHWAFLINGIGCILCAVILTLGQKWVFLVWTGLISITWFAYPLLLILFKRINNSILSSKVTL
ncbi:MAG: hypothetical protein C0410_11370 [Anaerolinea sp.]|nr:hypothetical protein [Anaerolinea sp.]